MKKTNLAYVLFPLLFITVYLVISFGLHGMRIKLEAKPVEYFLESIRYMAGFKSAVSFIVAMIPMIILRLVGKKRNTVKR